MRRVVRLHTGVATLGVALSVSCCAEAGETRPASEQRMGRAVHVSDTSDMPDSPITRGSVILVPARRIPDLEELVGVAPLNAPGARYASFRIELAGLESIGGIAAEIDSEGRFELGALRGRHLACLANMRPDDTPGPPYAVAGCAPVVLPGGSASVAVRFGEGGVSAVAGPQAPGSP